MSHTIYWLISHENTVVKYFEMWVFGVQTLVWTIPSEYLSEILLRGILN